MRLSNAPSGIPFFSRLLCGAQQQPPRCCHEVATEAEQFGNLVFIRSHVALIPLWMWVAGAAGLWPDNLVSALGD